MSQFLFVIAVPCYNASVCVTSYMSIIIWLKMMEDFIQPKLSYFPQTCGHYLLIEAKRVGDLKVRGAGLDTGFDPWTRRSEMPNFWSHCCISKLSCCFILLLVFCLRCVSHLTSVQTWRTSWGTCYRWKQISQSFTLLRVLNWLEWKSEENVFALPSGGSHKTLREPQERGQRHQGTQVVCYHWLDCHIPEKGVFMCVCIV